MDDQTQIPWCVEIQLFASDDLTLGPFLSKEDALIAAKQYVTDYISKLYLDPIICELERIGYYEDDELLISIHERMSH